MTGPGALHKPRLWPPTYPFMALKARAERTVPVDAKTFESVYFGQRLYGWTTEFVDKIFVGRQDAEMPDQRPDNPPRMIHPTHSPCVIKDGVLRVDRKFHVGACQYVDRLKIEVLVIAPTLKPDDPQMDFVEIPVEELTYLVETVGCDGSFRLNEGEPERVRKLVEECDFIYGAGFQIPAFARQLNKPYIPVVEYNLRTQIAVTRLPVSGTLRRSVRTVKTVAKFFLHEIKELRGAASIHCNGYPIYEQTRRINPDCLLYLDSRMGEEMIIDAARHEERLESLQTGRRPRLLYSGRYEMLKGALEVVEVGLELHRRGVDFDLDLYGKGELADEMVRRVEAAGATEKIHINAAIPYPTLVQRSHDSDLFVICHIQDDPSCTYLETCGSGLPIAGYDNRMWQSFCEAAENGVVTPMGRPSELADAIEKLLGDRTQLAAYARKSRQFAELHCFEREFEKRIDALRAYIPKN